MAQIGEVVIARIAPVNAAGASAPVFNVVWDDPGGSYDVSVSPDGLTATFVAIAAGVGSSAFVTATTKGGATLTAQAALPDVDAPPVDEEAVDLELTVG